MPDIDCNCEMLSFHKDIVTLRRDQQIEMRKRRDAGRVRLCSGLDQKNHAHPTMAHSQGSYAMRTMTQDANNDYDIDDGVYFPSSDLKDEKGEPLSAVEARERVCDALKWDGRLKHDATVKRNCVRQDYPEGYHIDVPVYRITTATDDERHAQDIYELASDLDWIVSDARAVTRWFNASVSNEINEGESDASQLRRITKLTKKFARSRDAWKSKTTSGICITKLVVDNVLASVDREDLALRRTWIAIKATLDADSSIKHPVQEDTLLAEPGEARVEFFRRKLEEALGWLEALDEERCDRTAARAIWDRVFNTSFFTDLPNDDDGDKSGGPSNGGDSGRRSITVTSTGTAKREDNGGRFG